MSFPQTAWYRATKPLAIPLVHFYKARWDQQSQAKRSDRTNGRTGRKCPLPRVCGVSGWGSSNDFPPPVYQVAETPRTAHHRARPGQTRRIIGLPPTRPLNTQPVSPRYRTALLRLLSAATFFPRPRLHFVHVPWNNRYRKLVTSETHRRRCGRVAMIERGTVVSALDFSPSDRLPPTCCTRRTAAAGSDPSTASRINRPVITTADCCQFMKLITVA